METATATNGAETEDTIEPIPDGAVGVVKGFGATVRADLSVAKHEGLIGCDVAQV